MIARYCGAMMGLMAFGVATIAGLSAGNPVQHVLGRALWSLFAFCGIGVVVGWAAQIVINDYERKHPAAQEALKDAPSADAGGERAAAKPSTGGTN